MADPAKSQFPIGGLVIGLLILLFISNSFSDGENTERTPFTLRRSPEKVQELKTPEEIQREETEQIKKEVQNATEETARLQKEVQEYIENAHKSEYADYITFRSVRTSRYDNPSTEYIILNVSTKAPQPIPITGWTIQSTVNKVVATIGQGTYLPFLGQLNSKEDIMLEPGSRVIINTGVSPNSMSFRTNICTGYFEQYQDFTPTLTRECPAPKTIPQPEPPNHFNDACVEYIERLPRCVIFTKTRDTLSAECDKFIREEINYNTCVELNKDTPQFKRNTWYIYLNRTQPLYKQKREHIEIRDQVGKLVAEKKY